MTVFCGNGLHEVSEVLRVAVSRGFSIEILKEHWTVLYNNKHVLTRYRCASDYFVIITKMPSKNPVGNGKKVQVNDSMQKGYEYELVEKPGKNFDPEFQPQLTPKEMLELGVFGGKYMTDCQGEFPAEWFKNAKLSPGKSDKTVNFFQVHASQPLSVWRKKGWIYKDDPRGWFQWYCRYYMGRRIPAEDARQIKRWKAIRRHIAQIKQNCRVGDIFCRPRQRQALLHWAYDSRKM